MATKIPVGLPGTRILNAQSWANNYGAGLTETPSTVIIFGQATPVGNADRWVIENYQDGYKVLNMGSNNWASSSGNQVLGTPDFDGETCKWWIEYTGNGEEFWIRVPGDGEAWTVRPGSAGAQSTVFLDAFAQTNVNQRFTFVVPT